MGCVSTHSCVCVCTPVCVHVCACAHMYVCVHMHACVCVLRLVLMIHGVCRENGRNLAAEQGQLGAELQRLSPHHLATGHWAGCLMGTHLWVFVSSPVKCGGLEHRIQMTATGMKPEMIPPFIKFCLLRCYAKCFTCIISSHPHNKPESQH